MKKIILQIILIISLNIVYSQDYNNYDDIYSEHSQKNNSRYYNEEINSNRRSIKNNYREHRNREHYDSYIYNRNIKNCDKYNHIPIEIRSYCNTPYYRPAPNPYYSSYYNPYYDRPKCINSKRNRRNHYNQNGCCSQRERICR